MGAGRATIESEHCRAICDEIGDRLREILSRDAPEPSAHLLQLLSRFEQKAPSVVRKRRSQATALRSCFR